MLSFTKNCGFLRSVAYLLCIFYFKCKWFH